MITPKIELNLYLEDIARVLRKTVYAKDFHDRYLDVMERTIFGMIQMQRELQVPDDNIVTFLSHFLRIPRQQADKHLIRYDATQISAGTPV